MWHLWVGIFFYISSGGGAFLGMHEFYGEISNAFRVVLSALNFPSSVSYRCPFQMNPPYTKVYAIRRFVCSFILLGYGNTC